MACAIIMTNREPVSMASPRKLVFFPSTLAQFYEFGPFRIDVRERLLFCNQRLVSLPLKVFETLLFLVQHNGHIVDKSELTRRLWPNTHVGPRSLAQNIFLLRKVLGIPYSQFIDTVPRRGYRSAATVQVRQEEEGSGKRIGSRFNSRRQVSNFRFPNSRNTAAGECLQRSSALGRPVRLRLGRHVCTPGCHFRARCPIIDPEAERDRTSPADGSLYEKC